LTRALPANRRTSLEALLRTLGLSLQEATAAAKVQWLLSLLDEDAPMAWSTFEAYARQLEAFGPNDEDERQQQALIVTRFAFELKNNRVFRPCKPFRAMPLDVFKDLVDRFERPTRLWRLPRARMRAQLKLGWSAGPHLEELRVMRRHWLTRHSDGYILSIQGGPAWANRKLAILALRDKSICSVAEMDRWLALLPPDPDGLLFPGTDRNGQFHASDVPFSRIELEEAIRVRLRRYCQRRYTYTSIRNSFLKRCRERLGDAATFYLSGLQQFPSYLQAMRGEGNFITFPDDRDLES
jgi:hypothetical protein